MGEESQRRVVPVSEILAKIERGEDVEYDGVIVEGDLDISGLELPTEHRTEEEKRFGLSEDRKVISSKITITNFEIQSFVKFENVHFTKAVNFNGAKFGWGAEFIETTFRKDASFASAEFGGHARFDEARFEEHSNFKGAKFSGYARFDGAKFDRKTNFGMIEVGLNTEFDRAKFDGDANFSEAKFRGLVTFCHTEFCWKADFWKAAFGIEPALTDGDALFFNAKFDGDANFSETEFSGGALFHGAKFEEDTYFEGAKFSGAVWFDHDQFSRDISFYGAKFDEPTSQEVVCRIAKREMEKQGNKKAADDYFYKEMEALRLQNGIKGTEKLVWPWEMQVSEWIKLVGSKIWRLGRYDLFECIFIQGIFGYGVHPLRVLSFWIVMAAAFALIYWHYDAVEGASAWFDYIWFSIATSATPGYALYSPIGYYKILTGIQAIIGTFMWAAFIATFARKWQR